MATRNFIKESVDLPSEVSKYSDLYINNHRHSFINEPSKMCRYCTGRQCSPLRRKFMLARPVNICRKGENLCLHGPSMFAVKAKIHGVL